MPVLFIAHIFKDICSLNDHLIYAFEGGGCLKGQHRENLLTASVYLPPAR